MASDKDKNLSCGGNNVSDIKSPHNRMMANKDNITTERKTTANNYVSIGMLQPYPTSKTRRSSWRAAKSASSRVITEPIRRSLWAIIMQLNTVMESSSSCGVNQTRKS